MMKRLGIFLLFVTLVFVRTVSFGQEVPLEKSQIEVKEGTVQTKESVYEEYEEFVKVVKELQDKYVDEIKINTILVNAYRGMLSGLDPYSQYFTPEDMEDLKIETEGEFEGLGIEVIIKEGLLTVITPLLDSPAFKAGILVGDRIVKIDGESTENMTIRDAVKKLRGKLGTKITLTSSMKAIRPLRILPSNAQRFMYRASAAPESWMPTIRLVTLR